MVITGGGTGVGKGITQAFADAGAAEIAILGRREGVLQETKKAVEDKTAVANITTYCCDIIDMKSVQKTAQKIGKWDIMVTSAGYLPTVQPFMESDPADWWNAFEVIA